MDNTARGISFRLWEFLGRTLFYITWPGIWLVVLLTPPRTRIIIEYKGKILLTKDWLGSGQWNLPGGGLHRNEPEAEGALRELYEETGIRLEQGSLKFVSSQKSANGMHTNLLFFRTSITGSPEISLQKYEILDYMWIETSKLDTVNMHPVSRHVVSSLTAT